MKGGKAQQRNALRIAVDHLKAGRALAKTQALFLQPRERLRPERLLANFVRMWSHALDVPIDLPNSGNDDARQHPLEVVLRGGEVLNGPKRHEKLRRDRSRIVDAMKKARVPIAKMMAAHSGHMFKWTTAPPPKKPSKSQRKRSSAATPATIDELFSALRDQVYEGRALECIVVAPPCWSGSSHAVLVEDSQREAAIVAVYNASAHVASQLAPGRVLRITNPYVRIAADQSILIRVDDPSTALRIGDLHEICWNCAIVHGGTTRWNDNQWSQPFAKLRQVPPRQVLQPRVPEGGLARVWPSVLMQVNVFKVRTERQPPGRPASLELFRRASSVNYLFVVHAQFQMKKK